MYRRLKASFWYDPKFEQLSPEAKLVYLYLYTSDTTSPAGTHRINPRTIDAEIGTSDAASDIAELESKGLLIVLSSAIFIPSFHREQRLSPYFTIAAMKFLKTEDEDVKKEFVRYYSNEILEALSLANLKNWEIDYLSEFAKMVQYDQCSSDEHAPDDLLKKGYPDSAEPNLRRFEVECDSNYSYETWNFDPSAIRNSYFYKFESPYDTVTNTVSNTVSDTVYDTTDKQIQNTDTDTAAAAAEEFCKKSSRVFHKLSTSFPHFYSLFDLRIEKLLDERIDKSHKSQIKIKSPRNRSP
jgi:hypothetical protein